MKQITTATLMMLTQPGFESFQDIYPSTSKEFESIVDSIRTERAFEVTAELRMMGAAQVTSEGAPSYADTVNQKGQKYFYIKKYTLMISPTEEILADNLYKSSAVPQYGASFMQSHILRQNLEAATILNEGWTTSNVGWDNLPYFSELHPYDHGVQSNTLPYAAPLHEVSINRLMNRLWYLKAINGVPIPENQARLLIVAPPLLPQATILMNSATRPGTGSFELNPMNELKYSKEGINVNRYIIPNGYYFRTRIAGFKRYERESLKTLQAPDPQNWSLIISSFMRYCFNFDNWRSMLAARAPLVAQMT